MPGRHNLLTGFSARYHNCPDNTWRYIIPEDLPTFPKILSDNGYETRTIGEIIFILPEGIMGI